MEIKPVSAVASNVSNTYPRNYHSKPAAVREKTKISETTDNSAVVQELTENTLEDLCKQGVRELNILRSFQLNPDIKNQYGLLLYFLCNSDCENQRKKYVHHYFIPENPDYRAILVDIDRMIGSIRTMPIPLLDLDVKSAMEYDKYDRTVGVFKGTDNKLYMVDHKKSLTTVVNTVI